MKGNFAENLQKSIVQALPRSLGTSFTTIVVLLAIFFFGGETLRFFALVLTVGIAVGTYASLLVAPSLLLLFQPKISSIQSEVDRKL